jgi:hypothetical protein
MSIDKQRNAIYNSIVFIQVSPLQKLRYIGNISVDKNNFPRIFLGRLKFIEDVTLGEMIKKFEEIRRKR